MALHTHHNDDSSSDEDWEPELQITAVNDHYDEDYDDDGGGDGDDCDDDAPVMITTQLHIENDNNDNNNKNNNESDSDDDDDDDGDDESSDEDWNPQITSTTTTTVVAAATEEEDDDDNAQPVIVSTSSTVAPSSPTTTTTTPTTTSPTTTSSSSTSTTPGTRIIRSKSRTSALHRASMIQQQQPQAQQAQQQRQQAPPQQEERINVSPPPAQQVTESQVIISSTTTTGTATTSPLSSTPIARTNSGGGGSVLRRQTSATRLDSDRKSKISEATTTVQQRTQEFAQATKYSGFLDKKNPYGIGKKRRWFTIEDGNIFYFDKKESSRSLGKICLQEVRDIVPVPKSKTNFVIQTVSRDYILMAENSALCEEWMANIRLAMSPYSQHEASAKKAARAEFLASNNDGFNLCGKLKKLGPNGGWRKRLFEYTPEEHTLSYRAKNGKSALGYIHLDKVLSVEKGVSPKISKKSHQKCIQIFTPGRNFILKAPDDTMCDLWYQTLLTELDFIKQLNEEEQQDVHGGAGGGGGGDMMLDLDNQVCGQLLQRQSDGTIKKRWIFFDDNDACIYVFNSRAGLDCINSGEPVEADVVDQVIPIQSTFAIEEMTPDLAATFHIKRDDAKYYFIIRAIKGEPNIFLCPTIQVKRSWIDSLQILKEFYDTADGTEDMMMQDMGNSSSADGGVRLGHTDALRMQRKPVAAALGITDIKEKPSGDVAMIDMAKVREGKEKIMYTITQGNRQVDVSQVEFSASSLHHRNVFIVDCGPIIYQWNGKHANKLQKAKGLELSTTIKSKERGGAAELKVIDCGSDMNDEMKKSNVQFWRLFGGVEHESKVPTGEAIGGGSTGSESQKPVSSIHKKPTLYRVSNIKDLAKAITTVSIPSTGKPNKDILNTKYVYVLETPEEVMVWIGKNTVPAQKNLAMVVAEKLLQQPDRKPWVKVTQVTESAETSLWKEKFVGYPGLLPISMGLLDTRGNIAEKREQQDVDVKNILKTSIIELKEDEIPFSENTVFKSQKMKIWRVNKFNKEEYPEQLYGHFFAQETYIILFTWTQKGAPTAQHILFFWQGRETSSQSKGASAVLSVGIDDKMDGRAAQIRIEQNREPVEFTMLFKGKFVVHKGSYTAQNSASSRLYDVRGTTANNVKAIEIESDYSRLNPLHCYILLQPGNTNGFIWRGSRAIGVEYDHAKRVAATMAKNITEVKEGGESDAFVGAFTTRDKQYLKPSSKPSLRHYSRLFLCTQSTGMFTCDEVRYVCQDEFTNHNNCYILVPYSDQGTIFVWLGRSSDDFVKKGALMTAEDMLHSLASEGFNKALVAYDGKETNEFFLGIHGWNTVSSTARRRSSIMSSNSAKKDHSLLPLAEVMKVYCGGVTHPYSVLLEEPLPEGVDPLKLESYLSEQDFAAVFDISKQEFYTYPVWKQQEMKKKVYLF